MTSSRLPGKSLCQVGGKPLIQYVIERVKHCSHPLHVALATSSDPSDDPLQALASQLGVPCVRGSLDDVAGRFLMAAEALGCEAVFRVNGDSPFAPVELFPAAIELLRQTGCDLVTNIFPRRYPPGMSLELIRADTYRRAYPAMAAREDREHVTRFLYQHPDRFRIHNMEPGRDFSGYSHAIDTPQDLERMKRMVDRMQRPHWTYPIEELVVLGDEIESGHAP